MTGVDVQIYRDGCAVMLNVVDENLSVFITFESEADFEDFKKEINKELPP